MPYLSFLFCEKCGEPRRLDIDFQGTLQAYSNEGRKVIAINQATIIWDYLVYHCKACNAKFIYTYRDVERRTREYLSNKSREHAARLDAIVKKNEQFEAARAAAKEEVFKRYGRR